MYSLYGNIYHCRLVVFIFCGNYCYHEELYWIILCIMQLYIDLNCKFLKYKLWPLLWTHTHTHVDTHPQLVSKRLSPTCREAMPKSAIRMLFFSSSSRFSGFRSLWLQKFIRNNWSQLNYDYMGITSLSILLHTLQKNPNPAAITLNMTQNPIYNNTNQMEWLWQKSKAEMICLKNFLASFGVSRPFFTR